MTNNSLVWGFLVKMRSILRDEILIFSEILKLRIEEPDVWYSEIILFNALKADSPGRMVGKICHLSVSDSNCCSFCMYGIKPALTKLDLPVPDAPKTTVSGFLAQN